LISPERHHSGVDGIAFDLQFPHVLFGFCMIKQQRVDVWTVEKAASVLDEL
jgi:hypothetical protein